MQASSELRAIIAAWFDSVEKGNTSWADRYISRKAGTRLVGTDPSEWSEGEEVAEFLRGEAMALGGAVKVAHGAVEAYQEGTVGWGLANPTLTLPNGVQISPRWSAVFHQEEGEWKLVQIHASVGISNQALMGMDGSG